VAAREARIYVANDTSGLLEDAVRAGGGTPAAIDDANVLVWAWGDADELLATLRPEIEWVQFRPAGMEYWIANGVIDDARMWTAGKGTFAVPIAEYVLTMIMAAARSLPHVLAQRSWAEPPARRVTGATLGIVGAGGIGSAVIEIVRPLSLRILALTRSGREVGGATESLGPGELDRLLAESDFVLLSAPATAATRGLLGARELGLLQPHAWLINVARGSLVDTDALVAALREGRIGGAALDVTDPEPLPDGHPLWELENVIITSHSANTMAMGDICFAERLELNVRRFVAGEVPLGLVDVAAGY
jgi:phosphoglycerate dehydrogenase-like enzyme